MSSGAVLLFVAATYFADWVATRYGHPPTSDTRNTTGFSFPHRYLWPAEMDLTARLAGMTRSQRWQDSDS